MMRTSLMRAAALLLLPGLLLTACTAAAAPQTAAPAETSTQPAYPPPQATADPAATDAATQLPPVPQTPFADVLVDATEFPDASGFAWSPVVDGLNKPVDIAALADGTGRLLIVEQGGTIRVLQEGKLLPDPFLDLRDRVGSEGSEQGLLGIAIDPLFMDTGTFYLNYTDRGGNTVIASFAVLADDPNRADPASEKVLLRQDQPYANHNGGGLAFGPDGFLYIGLGDGGSAGDPQGNAQSPDTWLGKLLRLDVSGSEAYTIPGDNPFVDGGGKPEIWALGLRNPWRFSFDPVSGDLFIGDVGQSKWEEINHQPVDAAGGINYGWKYREGAHEYEGRPPAGVQWVDPVAEYGHDVGCSVTGGVVMRDVELPEWESIYLYGDYCRGTVWGMLRTDQGWKSQPLFETGANISSFGTDSEGHVYLIDHRGTLLRLTRR